MNDKPLTTLAHKYPVGTRCLASTQWESFSNATITKHLPDGKYEVEDERTGKFDASLWYLETYFSLYSPEGVPYNYGL